MERGLVGSEMCIRDRHKLLTTFEITNEQIIKRMKSLKVHTIKKVIITTENLK